MNTTYSLDKIRQSYAQKREWEKQFPVSFYIFRPLSFYVTYVALRLTHSPSTMAWVGFVIGLAGCTLLLGVGTISIGTGIALLLTFTFLDAVDGNIARTTKTVTFFGKYLDGALGIVVESTYFLCLGLGMYLHADTPAVQSLLAFPEAGSLPLLVSGIVSFAGIHFSSQFCSSFSYLERSKLLEQGTYQHTGITSTIQSSRHRANPFYLILINLHAVNLQLLLLALAALVGAVDVFLLFMGTYYAIRFITFFSAYYRKAKTELS